MYLLQFMCISALSTCVYVHYMYAEPMETRSVSDPQQLKLIDNKP